MTEGDTVTVSRYHGKVAGTVHMVRPGYVTVRFPSGHFDTFDLSRRTVTVTR